MRHLCTYKNAYHLIFFTLGCFLVCFPQRQAQAQNKPADKIFFGGDFITVDKSKPSIEALAVYQGKIVAMGSKAEVLKWKGSRTTMIDLKGKTLMPGFVDAHTHPILSAMMGQTVDVSGFNHKSPKEVMASLRKGIQKAAKGRWVIAYGWDPAILRDLKPPTIQELDRLAPDNPLLIICQTLHMAFANTKAFQAANLSKETLTPKGSYFEKDKDGELTGTIIEVGAISKFRKATPKFPNPIYRYLLIEQMKHYAKAGYTTVVAPGLQPLIPGAIRSFQRVAENKEAPVRTHIYPIYEKMEKAHFKPGQGNKQFKVMGVKLWIDGSPYAGGMAMDLPYLNTKLTRVGLRIPVGSKGHLNFKKKALFSAVEKYHRQGWQIAAHVQGERAIAQFLDAVEAAQKKHPRKDHRHRMEHNALITKAQLQRATRLGVTTSFYIEHIRYYGDALYEAIVGPKRASRFMPIQSAKKAGQRFSIHTDTPSSPLDVLRAMQTAVTRKTRSGKYLLGPNERLSVKDVIKAVTIHAAWQIFEEDSRGSLSIGKLADFTILSQNLTKVPPEQWLKIKIVDTYIAGHRVSKSWWSGGKKALLQETAPIWLGLLFGFVSLLGCLFLLIAFIWRKVRSKQPTSQSQSLEPAQKGKTDLQKVVLFIGILLGAFAGVYTGTALGNFLKDFSALEHIYFLLLGLSTTLSGIGGSMIGMLLGMLIARFFQAEKAAQIDS